MKMNKKGITLVEVIVVLIIMAVLAGILVASYTGYIDKANDDKALVEARAAFLAASTIYHEAYAEGSVDAFNAGTPGTWTPGTAEQTEINDLAAVTGTITMSFTIEDGKITGMTYTPLVGSAWTLEDGVWGKN